MKKIVVLILIVFASPTFAAKQQDLTGYWSISQQIVDATTDTPAYKEENSAFVITQHDGDYFKGHACPKESDLTDLYGILEGKIVYLTAWDSLSVGNINSSGTEMYVISQKQNYNVDQMRNESSTARVVGTKLSNDPVCTM